MGSLDEFLATLWDHRITAILRTTDQQLASDAMDAAIAGGMRIVELTLTTPGALEIVAALSTREGLPPSRGLDRLVVGAGTVLRPQQARDAVAAGARFLVSPIMDPEIIALAGELGVPILPGVHTPTEMVAAHRAGAPLLKLFPGPAGGPAYLRSALAPLPFLRVVPTNGVDLDNAAAWLRAGAFAVGMTTGLFEPAALAARDLAAIERRAAALLAAVGSVERGAMPRGDDPFG
ncbi:bifunctional 4-hydroxy-2-oxoglutarate aldolase/2-dehydro-3-deoxy-phosphogluconate aldolase [Paraliomyxa miuraensis]|uniref:bifunctional 4-hydroxy-2-oxoglutarate aldolase/2-dehydro-3-deoxy-phosphogluconate aldolase n=1 Tax=Paraliomyxa miuraensis TaxID=376150 RepID=UPI00224EC072|nr:bifunctional 4-hydroxy-2-oxoglutarate aldolase/2-dehydro-3-deoxy-phosphogluconate aldolase [Paraliomyxa miuraensis]MCX4242985.1 bifunctional 4-hydroxy-2-oxoglutarate aldolase/2-dehydro-3-deoxy-phosphogluconate aldolase [Paraliomyxa miuraensis]